MLTGYVKDLVARHPDPAGAPRGAPLRLDSHGLPAELEAMKQLG
ncbi:hypothetical protein QJS66_01625 [Kocuria rhizophila]|nr:hypothetical protein QJS66_01625 [Kocuria rhizophila]